MRLEKLIALTILMLIFPFLILMAIIIKIESPGNILFWSKRYGVNKKIFLMPKFRSMKVSAPISSTQTFKNPDLFITKFGKIMRKMSIDELPQLWSIVTGEMSFIGPRPLLSTEKKLLAEREKFKGNTIKPGLTGWAQVNGRDKNSPKEKINYERFYIKNKSFFLDFKIIFKTLIIIFNFRNITH